MTTRAITFGAFDLLHYGHLRLLARIANMSDEVFVGLATDDILINNKGVAPVYPYDIRREMLLHTRYVSSVLCHDGPIDANGRVRIIEQKIAFIQEYSIDLVVMGGDWKGEYAFLEPYCEVRYLERTTGISTTQLRAQINTVPISQ
ncbi:adenylyltransferase/cytidyltransferase family protein [Limnobacter sp.]|jgi:glycerol-3-phosphate cytidylyltransferase|uniref:adenylyltransferase/cytidyltransferase family protein n=1 Tax=Limnobacter sp. TaxID=2003368 RepID=UPI0027B90AC7|nr:adenylyltransferase/cytidyltransferase family protein [Limnobacter sp.]